MPSFKIGAGVGRLVGELLALWFPHGMNPQYDRSNLPILPGAYAVAGAAAFAGSTTGALSSAVIIIEMTGQLAHLFPVVLCVLVSVYTSRSLGDSLYDTWISLKKLPYLPYVLRSNPGVSDLSVEDFMRRDLIFVWEGCTYKNIKHILETAKSVQAFPYVKSIENQIFLGTIDREELEFLLEKKLRRRPKQLSSRPFVPKLDSLESFIDDAEPSTSLTTPVKKGLVDSMKVRDFQ
jgi:chloride channel 2